MADHSGRVAMFAFMLAYEYYKSEEAAYRVATYGLFHDFSESLLKNDANSSIKKKYGIREILKQLEHDVVSDMFSSDTPASATVRSIVLEQCDSMDYKLFKMADTLDFGLFVWHEVHLGNQHLLPLIDSFRHEFNQHPEETRRLEIAWKTAKKILDESD